MVIYKLEEDPNIYISPSLNGNRFIYRMSVFVNDMYTRKVVRSIDLRNDKLLIHGTEMKEPLLRRLYESLTLGVRPKMGHIYVNCNGACYFFVTGKGICRPIYNVIYDWSSFQVVVPNSVNDSLRQRLQHKEDEVERLNLTLLSSAKDEPSSAKASLEAANKNIKELEFQLSSSRKENELMVSELRKLQDELKSTKKMVLESSRKKVNEATDCQSFGTSSNQEILGKVSEHLSSVSSNVKATNQNLDQALISMLWTSKHREDLPVFIAIEEIDD